jgi:hypothetical protein
MTTCVRPKRWLRACALLLSLTSAGCVCADQHGHHWLWHLKHEPKHGCKPVPYWEAPCYGFYPTCWQQWPAECPNCPPPCGQDLVGMMPEAAAEPIPAPVESPVPPESPARDTPPAIEPPPPAALPDRAAPGLREAAHFDADVPLQTWTPARRPPLPEEFSRQRFPSQQATNIAFEPPEPTGQADDSSVPEYFAPVSNPATARFRSEAP